MTLVEKLKYSANNLKKEIKAIYYAYKDPRVGFLPKLILALAIGYAVSPIDLIPDFIPVFGQLDDLIIVPLLISLAIKLIPIEIMKESRARAESEPLTLKKNWVFAVIIIFVWVMITVTIFWLFINFAIKRILTF